MMSWIPTTILAISCLLVTVHGQSRAFSDTQMFVDISMYNFYMGNSFAYDYILTARPGKQVHLYLFQNDYKQYTVEVRDGSQTYDKIIPVRGYMPSNDGLLTIPVPIVSSGQSMRVKITADQSNTSAIMDFQAMATDFVQPADCSNLVHSVNKRDFSVVNYRFPASAKEQCYYVIHANDPTNNPSLLQSMPTSLPSNKFALYKGLQTDSDHVLQHDELMSNIWASDKYLVVKPKETVDLTFGWTVMPNLDRTLLVNPNTHGSFMTNDYYQNNYPTIPGQLEQTFTLVKNRAIDSIQVSYVRMMGAGNVTVSAFTNNKQVGKSTVYHANQVKDGFHLTYNCDKLVLKYYTPSRPRDGISGLYGLYADGSTPF